MCFRLTFSQGSDKTGDFGVMKGMVKDGDTILVSTIPQVDIYPPYQYKNRWDYWRYRRLVRNVKAAYPYAKVAALKLKELDQRLVNIDSERMRKEYINEAEKQIRDEFEEEVRHLTISQGRILIKLIDRETGNTSYEVLKDLKGNFSAVFWQAIARVFGSTLKSPYEPEGEDRLIERIILMIEAGQL